MNHKSKILILGADSKIGSYLKRYLDKKYQVITTTRRKDLVSENSIYLDLEDPENFKKNKFFDYKAAIFCAAITNQKFCEDNINLAKKLVKAAKPLELFGQLLLDLPVLQFMLEDCH